MIMSDESERNPSHQFCSLQKFCSVDFWQSLDFIFFNKNYKCKEQHCEWKWNKGQQF